MNEVLSLLVSLALSKDVVFTAIDTRSLPNLKGCAAEGWLKNIQVYALWTFELILQSIYNQEVFKIL